nr:hypothetical protein [uncultured Desulfobacter sp.]
MDKWDEEYNLGESEGNEACLIDNGETRWPGKNPYEKGSAKYHGWDTGYYHCWFYETRSKKYPYIAAVEDYLGGIDQTVYPDGTKQFKDQGVIPPVDYSPRLPVPELEQFCRDNLDRYKQFYDQNKTAIENYDPIPAIESFWD